MIYLILFNIIRYNLFGVLKDVIKTISMEMFLHQLTESAKPQLQSSLQSTVHIHQQIEMGE